MSRIVYGEFLCGLRERRVTRDVCFIGDSCRVSEAIFALLAVYKVSFMDRIGLDCSR